MDNIFKKRDNVNNGNNGNNVNNSDNKIDISNQELISFDSDDDTDLSDTINEKNKDSKKNKGYKDINKFTDKLIKDFFKNNTGSPDNNNNLSFLLNLLDGINDCPGRIIVMTTNKPDTIDEAIIRPGRIDFNIKFKKTIKRCNYENNELYI